MKNPPKVDIDGAAAEMCLRKLSFFVREFWDVIVPNELVWNWHLDVLCDEIQASDERVFKRQPKLYDTIINVPPGTSKTKIISVLSTAWEFARMPEIKVFVGSYADSAVSGISDDIRLIMKSDKYKRYFPKTVVRRDRDNIHLFKTTSNGEFYAFTVGGALTSKHADILKIDDPLNPKQAASADLLKTANDFFDITLPSRKVDKEVTPTYLIMQRLATNDPTGHLLEKKGADIHHICLPAEVGPQVKPAKYIERYINGLLDPHRLGPKAIADAKTDLGSSGYAGQFDQLPNPPGGLTWKRWFIEVPDDKFPAKHLLQQYGTDWDTAFTKKEQNSASAYVTAGKLNGKIFIDDIGWKWLEFPDLVNWMKTKEAPHYIEAKASGKSAKSTLVKAGIVAIEVQVKGGEDKVARANAATPTAEAGMVCIRASLAKLLYEDSRQGLLAFPKGPHTDLADTVAQSIQRLSPNGAITIAGEGQKDDFDRELDELDY